MYMEWNKLFDVSINQDWDEMLWSDWKCHGKLKENHLNGCKIQF